MKRITLLLVGILCLPIFSYSGGIVNNQNQSAAYIRMFARDASTDIDAVFFNPAGLTKLDDGFYLSLNYQYINQNKVVTSNYLNLANTPVDFEGKISVPIFPGVYAAYKTGKFAISFGWNPVGGGGGAVFDNGLPSFEIPVSDLAAGYSTAGIQGYSLDAYFEGTSVFWGYQLGASYEINDMFSVYLGARYITVKNTYSGYLNDIALTTAGGPIPARDFVEGISDQLEASSNDIANYIALGYLNANDQFADPTGIATLTQLGLYQSGMTNSQAATAFGQGAVVMDLNAALLRNQEADVEQTGSGITPIIGVNISPNEKLNIGLKYELKTEIEIENNTTQDFYVGLDETFQEVGMFPDGVKTRSDMPAMFAAGLDYKITDKLSVASGFHMYFDKSADYGRKLNGVHVDNDEVIDRNSTEFAIGFEYKASEKLLLSIGYLNTQTGVTEDYQTDLSYSQHSNTVGFGGAYAITPIINMNVGFGYTVYNDAQKIYDYSNKLGQTITTTEQYDKDNLFIAFGLDFSLWGKKSE
ncbi:OmpP1/FadL family transporter [Bacteroidota bacterium]